MISIGFLLKLGSGLDLVPCPSPKTQKKQKPNPQPKRPKIIGFKKNPKKYVHQNILIWHVF